MNGQNRRKGYGALSMTAAIFGLSFLFTKNALDHLEIFPLLGFRFLTAALFLTGLRWLRILRIRVPREHLGKILLVALFQPILYFTFETIGVSLTTSSQSSVMISLIPVAVLIFSHFMLGERLLPAQMAAAGISMAGVLIIVAVGARDGGQGHLMGVLALLLAVAAGGLFNPMSRRISPVASPLTITYVMMWAGALVFTAAGLIQAGLAGNLGSYLEPLGITRVRLELGYLGILSSGVAFFLFNYGLARVEASRSAIFLNLVPVVSIWAGVVFRNESFSGLQVLGALLILTGIFALDNPRWLALWHRDRREAVVPSLKDSVVPGANDTENNPQEDWTWTNRY